MYYITLYRSIYLIHNFSFSETVPHLNLERMHSQKKMLGMMMRMMILILNMHLVSAIGEIQPWINNLKKSCRGKKTISHMLKCR